MTTEKHETKNSETASRLVALALLQDVLRKKQSLDDRMGRDASFAALEKRDRAFVHLLVATCLRRLGQLDATIKACLTKDERLKPEVEDLLRLGAAQLLFLDTPPHAAVNTTVDMAASRQTTVNYKGLINAVLRRLSREGKEMMRGQDAAKLNTPFWLWGAWERAFGEAVARGIAEAHLGEAPVDVNVMGDPAVWAEKLGATLLPNGSLRLGGTESVMTREGFEEGAWWVQDAAAACPAKLLGDVRGKRVLDLCAAPGGKSMQLAAMGAKVVALDISEKRLGRLQENAARLNLPVEIVAMDALLYKPEEKFELILLDAPCSATGTIRRHPDVTRLKKPEDVERLADVQTRLLAHARDHLLKDGGVMVYAVCSLQREEGEAQAELFLKTSPAIKLSPIGTSELAGCAEFVTKEGFFRTLPSRWADKGGMDGFFAARFVKGV